MKAVVKPVSGTAKPPGTVTFKEGGTQLAAPVTLALVGTVQTAKLSISTLSLGTHQITATYNPSNPANFATSTSLPITVTVGRTATTTKVSSSPLSPVIGQTTKLKATVKPASGATWPTGSVTFKDGTTTLGSASLARVGTSSSASATLSITGGLALGSHTITATYTGTTSFNGSDGSMTLTVIKGHTTTTVTATEDDTSPGKFTLVALVKGVLPAKGVPTGTVSFVVDSSAAQIVALSSTGRAQLKVSDLPAGSHTVTVAYDGDATFQGSNGSASFTS